MSNSLDGNHKFNNCIFRSKEQELFEVGGCGACGGARKSFQNAYRCHKRGILITETNKIASCACCWVGQELDGNGVAKPFKNPWER